MKSQKECYEALLAKKTLVNRRGYEACLNDNGMQMTSIGYSYAFEKPEEWHIKKEKKKYYGYMKRNIQLFSIDIHRTTDLSWLEEIIKEHPDNYIRDESLDVEL